jgi:hypothetical protein
MLEIAATCLVITALLAYLNHRFVGMPTAINVMASALILSPALIGLDAMGVWKVAIWSLLVPKSGLRELDKGRSCSGQAEIGYESLLQKRCLPPIKVA